MTVYVSPTGVEQEAGSAVEEVRLKHRGWRPKNAAPAPEEKPAAVVDAAEEPEPKSTAEKSTRSKSTEK